MNEIPRQPRRCSAFAALFMAPFFSGSLSRDVGRNWRGIGLRFLVFILLITWAATLAPMWPRINRVIHDADTEFAQQVPPITIQDGVVSSPVEQPYEIRAPRTGKLIFVLDTTGQ